MLLQELSRSMPWSMFRDMERLQEQLNRLVEGYAGRGPAGYDFPQLNVWTSEKDAIITAEIPGVGPDNIDITVVENNVSLSGNRIADEPQEDRKCFRQERGFGRFARTLELAFPIDADGVQAGFKNGVLEITLPRSREDRPRKIEIKSE